MFVVNADYLLRILNQSSLADQTRRRYETPQLHPAFRLTVPR